MIDLIIKLSLMLVMFVVGLAVTTKEVFELIKKPFALIVGLFLQMILLPMSAFAIACAIETGTDIKVGLVILALCPGGTTSNFLCYLLGFRIVLSVGLTAFNSILAVFTLPLGAKMAYSHFAGETAVINFPFLDFISSLLITMIFPLILGFMFNRQFSRYSKRLGKILKLVTICLFSIAYLIKFFGAESNGGSGMTFTEICDVFPFTFLLVIVSLFGSLFILNILSITSKDKLTLCVEVGLQNVPLALLVSTILLESEALAKPALVYSLYSFPLVFLFSYTLKSRLT